MHLSKAFHWFFKVLRHGEAALPQQTSAEPQEKRPEFHASPEQAIQLIGLFQKEGRLIDFLKEDISAFGNEDIGAAIRDIHAGCNKVLNQNLKLRRVLPQTEGELVNVEEGFDPSTIEIMGAPESAAPYKGELMHAGWYVEALELPSVAEGADPKVLAPAQVEVR